MALTLSTARKNAALDSTFDQLNSGFIDIYDGSRPAGPDTAVTSQVKLARLPMSATAFAAATGGTKTANAITADSSADATGTASWFRMVTSGGTAVVDGSIGTSGADMNFSTVSFVAAATIEITSFVVTQA